MTHPNAESDLLREANLQAPLNTLLNPAPAAHSANWHAISERLDGRAKEGPLGRLWLPLAFLAALTATALVFTTSWLKQNSAEEPTARTTPTAAQESRPPPLDRAVQTTVLDPASAPRESGGLLLANGKSFEGLRVAPGVDGEEKPDEGGVEFSDGSTLTARGSAELSPLAMTQRDVILRLLSGAVDVYVVPGGPRRWVIEAGSLSVEVVGTRFSVARNEDEVQVQVSKGAVLVRSEKLEDGVQRLLAGEHLSVETPPVSSPSKPKSTTTPKNEEAAPKDGPGRATAAELLESADAARLRGDLIGAQGALRQLLSQHRDDPRAGLAAFQLAVLQQQRGAAPAEVVSAFTRALRRASGSSLRQDCYIRLMDAQLRAGNGAAARSTAARALTEFPKGRHAGRFNQLLTADKGAP